jgi:dTMP kinase
MYIAFEGVDTVGKSTQVKKLKKSLEFLMSKGVVGKSPIVMVTEPSKNTFGRRIKKLAFGKETKNSAKIFLFMSSLVQQSADIRNAINANKIVLADRSFVSTMVYQKDQHTTAAEIFKLVNTAALPIPDLFIFLYSNNPAEFLAKRKKKDEADNLSVAQFAALTESYRYIMHTQFGFKTFSVCVDGLTADEIDTKIMGALTQYFMIKGVGKING